MRYYFQIHIDGALIVDDEGMEFENEADAKSAAINSASELALQYRSGNVAANLNYIAILDDMKAEVFIVPIGGAAEPTVLD